MEHLRHELNIGDDVTQQHFSVDNMSTDSESDFEKFMHRIVEQGGLFWRVHEDDKDVFVMNAYDCRTGAFMPQKFVTCECLHNGPEVDFHCSCETYKLLSCLDGHLTPTHEIYIRGSATCMHCRFLKEHFLLNRSAIENDASHNSPLFRTLLQSKQHRNAGVVQLTANLHSYTFSVRGRDNTLSFVHLSRSVGIYVSCQSGECEARHGSKRSAKRLLSLRASQQLCPHLDIFHGCSEQWQHLLPAEDPDDEDVGPDGGGQQDYSSSRDDTVSVQTHFEVWLSLFIDMKPQHTFSRIC